MRTGIVVVMLAVAGGAMTPAFVMHFPISPGDYADLLEDADAIAVVRVVAMEVTDAVPETVVASVVAERSVRGAVLRGTFTIAYEGSGEFRDPPCQPGRSYLVALAPEASGRRYVLGGWDGVLPVDGDRVFLPTRPNRPLSIEAFLRDMAFLAGGSVSKEAAFTELDVRFRPGYRWIKLGQSVEVLWKHLGSEWKPATMPGSDRECGPTIRAVEYRGVRFVLGLTGPGEFDQITSIFTPFSAPQERDVVLRSLKRENWKIEYVPNLSLPTRSEHDDPAPVYRFGKSEEGVSVEAARGVRIAPLPCLEATRSHSAPKRRTSAAVPHGSRRGAPTGPAGP